MRFLLYQVCRIWFRWYDIVCGGTKKTHKCEQYDNTLHDTKDTLNIVFYQLQNISCVSIDTVTDY